MVQVPGPHRDGQVSSVELLKIKVLAAAEITVISIITLLGFHGQVQRLLLHTEHGAAGAPMLLLAGHRLPTIYTSPGGRTMLGGRAEVSCAGAALRVSGAVSREPPGGTQRPAWCRHTGAACDAREMARERGCGAWDRGPGPLAEMGRRRVTSEHFITGQRTLGHCAPVPSPSVIIEALQIILKSDIKLCKDTKFIVETKGK